MKFWNIVSTSHNSFMDKDLHHWRSLPKTGKKETSNPLKGWIMARFLSFVFLVAAAVRAYFDWQAAQGFFDTGFNFAPIGQVWSEIHFGSLQVIQPAIERYLSPDIWEYGVLPVLLWPMAPVFFAISVLFWVTRRRKPRIKKISNKAEEITGPVRRMR